MADADAKSIVFNETWNAPLNSREDIYPFCQTERSLAGHTFEVDDTPGAERIHREHKCGSYETFDATGGRSVNIVGDSWRIIANDEYIQIHGNANINVGGTARIIADDLEVSVKNNYRLVVGGKSVIEYGAGVSTDVVGDNITNISGNCREKVYGGHTFDAYSGSDITIQGDLTTTSTGNTVMNSRSFISAAGLTSTVAAGVSMKMAAQMVNIGGGLGQVNVDAGNLNVLQQINVLGGINCAGPIICLTNVLALGAVFERNIRLAGHVHGGVESGPSATTIPIR